eukprot:gene51595-63085_t
MGAQVPSMSSGTLPEGGKVVFTAACNWVEPGDVRIETEGSERRGFHVESGVPIEIGAIEKMSKSKKNVVAPEEISAQYGIDASRLFILSDSPPDRDVQWTTGGVEGASRFVQR